VKCDLGAKLPEPLVGGLDSELGAGQFACDLQSLLA